MTCGLRQAGIDVIAGVDFDKDAKDTYEFNNPDSKFVLKDISLLSSDYFETEFGIKKNDDLLVFVGCSPCQYYSIINSDKRKSQKSKDLLMQFLRFVDHYRPGYVLVENVPGILTNKNTILYNFLDRLFEMGYGGDGSFKCQYGIVNMKYYGVPQNRRRFSLIATRLDRCVSFPVKDEAVKSVRDAIGDRKKFPKILAGFKDKNHQRFHSSINLSVKNLKRLSLTPLNGGSRLSWKDNKDLQLQCYCGKDTYFRDVYGRLYWEKPANTITTKFLSISNGRFAHPEQNRGLSIREGAALQSFPDDYCFMTDSLTIAARLIGNAVPPEYAKRIGAIINA